MKRKMGLFIILMFGIMLCACRKKEENQESPKTESIEEISLEQQEKGYNLPITDSERAEAESDCKKMMESISHIYKKADKGITSNVVISDEVVSQMQDVVKETKYPVTSGSVYSNMENYKSVEKFLKNSMDGKSGSIIIYEVHTDGGIGRSKYTFDGTNIYVLSTRAVWNEVNEPQIVYLSNNRIKEWEYTNKGWFCYQLCVPEPPEVTEIVDRSCMIRIKPMKDEYRRITKQCVLPLGYQGNNILCSNWDTRNLEYLDYNGMYEYLYGMKYQRTISSEKYINGIPKEEFESLIMEYLPVTSEQIQKYAIFNKDTQTYSWEKLRCFNYTPTFFATSMPEVTAIREKEDGTVTLIVDAVCETILCDDAVITHELTIRFSEDAKFQYLGNKVLGNGIENVPEYQYRFPKKK